MNPLSDARRGGGVTIQQQHQLLSKQQQRPNKKRQQRQQQQPSPLLLPTITTTTTSKGKATNDNKKIDIMAKEIWFRKSNMGYHCFIEYYKINANAIKVRASIVDAVASSVNNDETRTATTTTPTPTPTRTPTAITASTANTGNSRAAQRRQRQKQKQQLNRTQQHQQQQTTITMNNNNNNNDNNLNDTTTAANGSCCTTTTSTAAATTTTPATTVMKKNDIRHFNTTNKMNGTTTKAAAAAAGTLVFVNKSSRTTTTTTTTTRTRTLLLWDIYRTKFLNNNNKSNNTGTKNTSTTASNELVLFSNFIYALSIPLPITFRIRKQPSLPSSSSSSTQQLQDSINTNVLDYRKQCIQFVQDCFIQPYNNNNMNDNDELASIIRKDDDDERNNDGCCCRPMFLRQEQQQQVEYYQLPISSKNNQLPIIWNSNLLMNSGNNNTTTTTWNDLLLQYSQNGCIARQELGSMLPVISLYYSGCFDNKNTTTNNTPSTILDMCSSPGSKLLQTIEYVLSSSSSFSFSSSNINKSTNRCYTIIVANDVLQSRLNALQDAVQRSGYMSLLLNKNDQQKEQQQQLCRVMYTCQDASQFVLRNTTTVKATSSKITSTTTTATKTAATTQKSTTTTTTSSIMKYHIILCDVPCSGDGTIRKDKLILSNWKPNIGNLLHTTQVNILFRALQLLHVSSSSSSSTCTNSNIHENNKNRGCFICCYSTCTMNPVENEAVVAAAMIRYNKKYNNNCNKNFSTTTADRYSCDRTSQKRRKVVETTNDNDTSDKNFEASNQLTYVTLLDCPKLNNVQLHDGITQWKVAEYQHDSNNDDLDSDDDDDNKSSTQSKKQILQWYDSYDDAISKIDPMSSAGSTVLVPTLYPSSSTSLDYDTDMVVSSLPKCRRLVPSISDTQDSGGFFYAMICKYRSKERK